ncbi:MAG: hypothetical protein KJ598_04425 [Nanoarchaeota archaeon]|nr:hypothetical protein [Nanoarchaeota archaeon]MBU1644377.1 hypothetical protein [Nanoarchaeota archaeon]
MKKSKFVLSIVTAGLVNLAAGNSSAEEQEELAQKAIAANNQYFVQNPQDPRKKDWDRLLELKPQHLVALSPNEDGQGFHVGLDCVGDVLEAEEKEKTQMRSCNGKLDPSEWFRNYSVPSDGFLNKEHYTFRNLGTLPKEPETIVPPQYVVVPVPGAVIERPVEKGKFTPALGFVYNLTPFTDEKFGFDGSMYGGKFSLTFQPRNSPFYFGGEVTAVGNENEKSKLTAPQTVDGPLEGRLFGKGSADFALSSIGLGLGAVGGNRSLFYDGKNFDLGLELSAGMINYIIMKDIAEQSAHYIDGKLVEGSEAKNSTSSTEVNPNFYGTIGLPLSFPFVRATPFGGITAGQNGLGGLVGITVGYSPRY